MRKRSWWVEIPNSSSVFNFKWQPTSHRMKFRELQNDLTITQVVNHFEFHRSLSEKSELFYNLLQYSELTRENVFRIIPLTFSVTIDMKKRNGVESSLNEFLSVFKLLESSMKQFTKINDSCHKNSGDNPAIPRKILNTNLAKTKCSKRKNDTTTKIKAFSFQKRSNSNVTKFEMPLSHFSGHNFWILKVTNLNRGRGIHVFKDIKSLK